MSAPVLYVPIGIPGSGKSTLADNMVSSGKLSSDEVVSPDAIRAELYGHHSIQGDGETVFGIAYERVYQRLRAGRSAFFDATNLTSKTRRQLQRTAQRTGAEVVWFVLDVPEQVCRQRNAQRSHPVPDDVMDRMVEQMALIDFSVLPGWVIAISPVGGPDDTGYNVVWSQL